MTKTPIDVQDLRRRIYLKAKAEPTHRFWGIYTHICKMETLWEAYLMARANDGSPGTDGETFEAIEESGVEQYLKQIREELIKGEYRPRRARRQEIPKSSGAGVRVLSIPAIRDRVVQGAVKLILEPIFEADFQAGSHGYRPKRTAHQAVERVAIAIAQGKTRIIDLDLRAYFDNIRHDLLLKKVANRVSDNEVMHLLKVMLKAAGKRGVPQGSVISPLLSNVYLTEVDKMLERAKEVTANKQYTRMEWARFADDLVVLVDGYPQHEWLVGAVEKRLREEIGKLSVEVNEEKSRKVDLQKGESFGFLGFEFRMVRSQRGTLRANITPKAKKRKELLGKLKEQFQKHVSQPVERVIAKINPILRGWVNYFRVGDSHRCFSYIRDWVERKIRRHLMRNQKRGGYGWKKWSRQWIHEQLGVWNDYRVTRYEKLRKVASATAAT